MLSCEDVARLISEQQDRPLSIGQRVGIRLHLMFCALCRGYQKNLEMLGRIAARAGDAVMSTLSFGGDQDVVLSADSKQRMKNELERANPNR